MDSLNAILKQQAVEYGLCKQWTQDWDHSFDDFEFCEKFKSGQDFRIKNDYPSLDFIRKFFDRASLSRFGVFVDEIPTHPSGCLPNGTYVCMGDCEGEMNFGRWCAAIVYIRHNSKVKINAGDFSRIKLFLYDNSEVIVNQDESAHLTIKDKR